MNTPAKPLTMRDNAAHSLARDFTLLSAFIVFLALITSLWVGYETYEDQSQRIIKQLENESTRIDRALISEMENANYLLSSLARQIARSNTSEAVSIARLLKAFDATANDQNIFSWINAQQQVVASSNRGVLAETVDVSDRDYVKKSLAEPWQPQVGRPIEGRVSRRWVMPVAMGLTDDTGKFIGTIVISVDIPRLSQRIAHVVNAKDVSFGIASPSYGPVMQLSDDPNFVRQYFAEYQRKAVDINTTPNGIFSTATPYDHSRIFGYYSLSSAYPYVILVGYNLPITYGTLFALSLPRLLQVVIVASFLISFLWLIRLRIIRPVVELSSAVEAVAHGERFMPRIQGGPAEIQSLAEHIYHVDAYIRERIRLEEELYHKMQMLKKAKDVAEFTNRVKVEFLASLSKELRTPLNSIVGFSEVMKREMYGPLGNPTYVQYASDIHTATQQLLEVIEDVLQLSRAESGLLEMSEKPLDVGLILKKVTRLLSERLQDQNIGLQLVVPEGLPKLLIDELRLKQIIINLLTHAAKHTPSGRNVVAELKLERDKHDHALLALYVTDGGESASTQIMARPIETKVATVDNNKKKVSLDVSDLSGLGIPLTKTLVTMVDATLSLDYRPGKSGVAIVRFAKDKLVFWEAS